MVRDYSSSYFRIIFFFTLKKNFKKKNSKKKQKKKGRSQLEARMEGRVVLNSNNTSKNSDRIRHGLAQA